MRRWIVLGALLVVSQALLADSCASATSTSGSPPAAVGGGSTSVPATTLPPVPLTFTASGSKQTINFTTGGAFTLSWTSSPAADCGNLLILASVFAKGRNPNTDAAAGGPFTQSGCGGYTTEVNVGPGDYFLSLDVANGTAIFTVTQH